MERIRLVPLVQADPRGRRPSFLRAVFEGSAPPTGGAVPGDELVATALSGGYPEAPTRRRWSRRRGRHLDHVSAIVRRDAAQVERLARVQRLLRVRVSW